eukprot:TRINITY_DN1880_c0_g1_i1.p2 TRINITY_DN1880_c0_g1~~TRINITY_DN1880_c0_g1_i1.p2  ORF type:complete len:150 (+),score=1.33 TRINITY_DN1880_c0_g1_i1:1191-1640(+)
MTWVMHGIDMFSEKRTFTVHMKFVETKLEPKAPRPKSAQHFGCNLAFQKILFDFDALRCNLPGQPNRRVEERLGSTAERRRFGELLDQRNVRRCQSASVLPVDDECGVEGLVQCNLALDGLRTVQARQQTVDDVRFVPLPAANPLNGRS